MKTMPSTLISILVIVLLMMTACSDESEVDGSSSPGDVVLKNFQISFYVVDSLDNPVFPADGEYLSELSPEDYYVTSELSEDIGIFNQNSTYGHVFRIIESVELMRAYEIAWQTDSVFQFYPCFGNRCDTLFVYNPFYAEIEPESSAEWIYWNGDTIFDYQGLLLQYEINN